MKKVLMLMLALMWLPVMAEQRTASDALNVATSYLHASASRHALGAPTKAPQLSLAMAAVNADQKVDYYVFNNSQNRGFVVVSGDDKVAPVLGYCDEGSFDANDIPDGLRYMLDCYAEQIQYARTHSVSAYAAPSVESTVNITPLLTCNWNQNSPFNDLCPTFGTENVHAATGCVATATAQVMNYHKWPKQGTGNNSYVCNVANQGNQTLSADFGSTTYDWANMLDHYTAGAYSEAEGNAVATLMYHVGVASNMNYGVNSNAPTYAAMTALRTYFGYNKSMRKYLRSCVPAEQWDSLIMNELLNSRPVIYSGFTPKGGGHCFVLDGCNSDSYYHFNWGWGGKSNGYFLITALNPTDQGIGSYEGGYNCAQEFIAGIYPDQGEPEPQKFLEVSCDRFWPAESQVNLGQEVPICIRYLHFNGYGYGPSTTASIGLMLSDNDGNVISLDDSNIKTLNFVFGSNYIWTTEKNSPYIYHTPSTLADGQYKLWLMYKQAEMTAYDYLDNIPNIPSYICVNVQNGVMNLSTPVTDSGNLSITDLVVPDAVGCGSTFEVSAAITNTGNTYFDNVYFYLTKDDATITISDPMNINVLTGGKVAFKSKLTAPTEPGEYGLQILDKELNLIAGGAVTLSVVPSSNSSLAIATQLQVAEYYMDMDDVRATAVISNNGTVDYVGPIPFMILTEDSKQVLAHGSSPTVTIPAGGSTTVNIKTTYEGIPLTKYKLCLRDPKYPDKNVVWGDQVLFEVNGIFSTILLENLFNDGVLDGDYHLADNLTIVDSHNQSLFATNGRGSWIEVKCGSYFDQVKDMKAFKAGTVWGKYGNVNGNPSITLTKLPEAGLVQDATAEKVDLTQPFTLAPDEVIDFTGYFSVINGDSVICAYEGSDGNAGNVMPIATDWLGTISPLIQGQCYDLHGVVVLTPLPSGAPVLKADETTATCTVYLTKAPVPYTVTAITGVNNDAVTISVTTGAISVSGACHVAVYNLTGALVGKGNEVQLPAGIYIVIADGHMRKVAVP